MGKLAPVLLVLLISLCAAGGYLFKTSRDTEAKLKADLAQMTTSEQVHATRDAALTDLLNRDVSLDKILNNDLMASLSGIQAAERYLASEPGQAAFEGLKASYDSSLKLVARIQPMLTEFGGIVDKDGAATPEVKAHLSQKAKVLTTKIAEMKDAIEKSSKLAQKLNTGIYGNQAWQTTDLTVEQGMVVAVAGKGRWEFGGMSKTASGPEGVNWSDAYRVLQHAPNGALIARIHGSEAMAPALPSFQADRSGRVELRINDSEVSDNKGTMDVDMWAFKPV